MNFNKYFLTSILLLSFQICTFGNEDIAIKIVNLRCENRINPIGIDILNPHMSWNLESNLRNKKQSGYQILVSNSSEELANNAGNYWDSGKMDSDKSIQIKYNGKNLSSESIYYWKVRAWDEDGNISEWSQPARWEMGLLKKNDWRAQWINDGKSGPKNEEEMYQEDPAPLFRNDFIIDKKISNARLYITGVGYYEASINGQRVGDHMLDPGWTNYGKRVQYSTFDVTSFIHKNSNTIGIMLGNGWYNPLPLPMFTRYNLREHLTIGRPQFIAQLRIDYADGTSQTVVSNEKWKTTEGPILRNNIYLGEVYDARKEIKDWNKYGFDDNDWNPVEIAKEKLGKLQAQNQPPIKITAKLNPVKLNEPTTGVFIFDMGQNFAGWAMLKVKAPTGTKIKLRYGELLHEDGTLNVMTSVAGQIKRKNKNRAKETGHFFPDTAWQQDIYITNGSGIESYTPRFTFHAFRYVEVSGYPGKPTLDMIEGLRLNSDLDRHGSFECSNNLFNEIQKITDWTFLSNIFSVQSDCPHRERFGYGGDLAATTDAFIYNYDMSNFYTKVVRDFQDAAFPNGRLTDTAPFVGIDYCGIGWAFSHPLTLLELYQYYGNISLIEEQYDIARKWFETVIAENDLIITHGLSDHESLAPIPTSEMVTPLYFQSAKIMARLAKIINRMDDSERYGILLEKIKKAYLEKYLDKGSGKFSPNTQASQSFALYMGIAPEDEIENAIAELVSDIEVTNQGHLTTGIFGTKYSLDVLSKCGQIETASKIVNQKSFPGWGHMIANGATTLWEHWEYSDNTYSHNHPMFGSVSEWFYKWVAGIQADQSAVGFDKIVIRPQIISNVNWSKAEYISVNGIIQTDWERHNHLFKLNVTIPFNCSAKIYLPTNNIKNITESGKGISDVDDVEFIKTENGSAIFSVGSGSYSFISQIN